MKGQEHFNRKFTKYLQEYYSDYKLSGGNSDLEIKKRITTDDPFILNNINKSLKKFGNSFRIPKKGTPAILICSGGIDSVLQWFLALDKFKLKVFPIHFGVEVLSNPVSSNLRNFHPNNF